MAIRKTSEKSFRVKGLPPVPYVHALQREDRTRGARVAAIHVTQQWTTDIKKIFILQN